MRMGILAAFAGRNAGGPETYEVELLRALAALDRDTDYHVLCLSRRAPSVFGVQQENIRYHVMWPSFRPLSLLTTVPATLLSRRVNLVHATFMPPPISFQSYVFTMVCDSMFERPQFYPPAVRWRLQALTRLALRRAKLVLCISDSIRTNVMQRFGVPGERLAVVHLGVSPRFRPLPEDEKREFLRRRYNIHHPYLLFSGRWEPRKNLLRILEAFAAFKRESPSEVKLVLTGLRTWIAREADEIIARHGLQRDVIDLGKSPVDELPMLYGGAQALVFPSLWEGFGLPIVEAMACGTPVITSGISSMPEIAGPAALLVDPLSTTDIATAMHTIVSDDSLRATLSSRGLERARLFTWERTARQTLAAYRQIASVN